ncbi:MAG: hypothetical protein V4561_02265 [Bacteroidota bacterium]
MTYENKKNILFKKIFYSSLVLMLGILWVAGYDSGYGSDEMDMNIYGKANIAYYTSGFKDTTFLHPDHKDGIVLPQTLPYYGSGFEYFATGLTGILGDDYEYNTRHILNQLIAILGLLFTGLIAAKIKDYKAAILSIWLIYLTPIFFGLSVFDTKDIPFLSTYIASLYFAILFFQQLPNPRWTTVLGLAFSLWFLLSIRIGGVLIIGFIGLYAALEYWKDKSILNSVKNWGTKLVIALGTAFIMMILLWPFILQNPAENIIKTLNVVKDFPQKILVAYDGEYIDSLTIPKYYLIKMLSVSIPLSIQLILLTGLLFVVVQWKKTGHKNILILLFLSGLFPVVYAIYSAMPLYNSWRHLLFIYPPLVILGSVGAIMAIDQFSKPVIQLSITALFVLGLIKPVIWCIQNNPYQYTYFNELSGGFQKAYYEYDTDYWQITTKEAIDWLMKNEPIEESKDTLIVSTNAYTFANYYFKKRYPKAKVKCEMVGEKTNFGSKGVYSIFNSLFLEPNYIENCFPSPLSIHTVDIDHMPITYIAKDTLKYLYKAYTSFQQSNYIASDSFFTLYHKQIKYEGGVKNMAPYFGVVAYAKFATDSYDTAFKIAQQCLTAYPSDYMSNLTLGAVLIAKKDYKKAKYFLEIAQELEPSETAPQTYINLIPKR